MQNHFKQYAFPAAVETAFALEKFGHNAGVMAAPE